MRIIPYEPSQPESEITFNNLRKGLSIQMDQVRWGNWNASLSKIEFDGYSNMRVSINEFGTLIFIPNIEPGAVCWKK